MAARMEMTAGSVCRKLALTNSVDCCYAMPVYNPELQLLWEGGARGLGGLGGRLQVDELVHQHQGASQAGQAGFRAATVTARVAT